MIIEALLSVSRSFSQGQVCKIGVVAVKCGLQPLAWMIPETLSNNTSDELLVV
jgi:hypothetical protein